MILRKFICSAATLAVSLVIVYNSDQSLITCLIGAEIMYLSGYVLLVELLELWHQSRRRRQPHDRPNQKGDV